MQWITNIAFFLVLSGILLEMIADTKYYKFARFVAGIILMLQFFKPLTETDKIGERFSIVFHNFDFALDSERVSEEIYQISGKTENTVLDTYKQTIAEQVNHILENNGLTMEQIQLSVKSDGSIQSMKIRAVYMDGSDNTAIVIPTVMPICVNSEKQTEVDTVSPLELYIRTVLAEFYQLEENKIEVVIQEAD